MNSIRNLSHSRWRGKYYVVWSSKCRSKSLYGYLCQHLGEVFHDFARQKESLVLERYLRLNHIHMLMSISPK